MGKHLIQKVADKFTDTFYEQISDHLITYGLEVNDNNVDDVIKEIVKIYK